MFNSPSLPVRQVDNTSTDVVTNRIPRPQPPAKPMLCSELAIAKRSDLVCQAGRHVDGGKAACQIGSIGSGDFIDPFVPDRNSPAGRLNSVRPCPILFDPIRRACSGVVKRDRL
jgi:hypothetical protein